MWWWIGGIAAVVVLLSLRHAAKEMLRALDADP